MRLLWTFIWSFLLVQMMSYVISSMNPGGTYDVGQATIMSVIVTIVVFVISAILPNEPVSQHH